MQPKRASTTIFVIALIVLFVSQTISAMEAIKVSKVESSSHYTSKKYGADGLHPNNLIAEKSKFGGWISDINQWQKSWIDFYFNGKPIITGVEILNGFIETDQNNIRDDYYYHLRPRQIQIIPNGVKEKSIYIELEDSKEEQLLKLNFTDKITKIRLVIHSVYSKSPDPNITAYEVVGFRHVRWFSD